MASDPSDDYKAYAPAMGQWTTIKGPSKASEEYKELTIIWKPMYLLNGMDKVISVSGSNNGEWFQFKQAGYYKIDITIGLTVSDKHEHGWVMIADNKGKEIYVETG